jgi:hypothetical protein
MIDPSLIAELEGDLKVALTAYQGAVKHVQYLGLSGKTGIRHARNGVARTNAAALRAEMALARAKMGMG